MLALVPRSELLADAMRLADGNALGVVEHGEGEVAGWAAATGAIDLSTGIPAPDIDSDLREAMESVHDAGYNGYSVRDSFLRKRIDEDVRMLVDAGFPFGFVGNYLVGLGAGGHRLEGLEKIYREYERP
ncbi:MAG: hypothetical protein CME34_16320 [Gordonia sp.]|nr:hypothetical protein [Gordonia sp. (in: high G+C Gram-positive bacteria)]